MTEQQDFEKCAECGALVEQISKHRRWHEALNRVVPRMREGHMDDERALSTLDRWP